ncbi:hypothetical protein Taro_030471, partial [Colocasia esculenta]|nr:hypothetical protein [Colocasia esculenta]
YMWDAIRVKYGIERVVGSLPRMYQLAQGGTAVGTGLNTKKGYASIDFCFMWGPPLST